MSNKNNNLLDPHDHLPLGPLDFQVLLLVADEPLHGYGIVQASRHSGRATLELGSLYRILSRLTQQGLIEDAPVEQPQSKRQRRYYLATDLGRRVARAEALRLQALLGSENALALIEE